MGHVLVLGGGLAGLASAAALGDSAHHVTLLESRAFLGGRATSYPVPSSDSANVDSSIVIDNCQHILLRCCVNLLDFYRRLDVVRAVHFYREFYFLEPGGRMSVMKAGFLPTPLHFAGSFATLRFLALSDKVAVARAMLAVQREFKTRSDLDRITMLDWLREKRQPPRAIQRFWRQILVSAINEDLERMAARHGLQVFWLGFLARSDSYEMGVPAVPLGELYSAEAWKRIPGVEFRLRTTVTRIVIENNEVAFVEADGERFRADHYISALPWERLQSIDLPSSERYDAFEHSPITGIHLWFDRPVTDLPHATLLDRTIQWFYNKDQGRYLQLVVSASRSLTSMSRQQVIDLALKELAEYLPAVKTAHLERAHVVKEMRATFSAKPGLESVRPQSETAWPNFSLAGDWTRSGWPATMEGAVRSGYLAAEAACRALGCSRTFLLPDIA